MKVTKEELKKMRLLNDRLIVIPLAAEKISEAGIIIPASVSVEKPSHVGVVVQAGPGFKDLKREASIGDTVVYSKHSGTPIEIEGEGEALIIRDSDLFAIL